MIKFIKLKFTVVRGGWNWLYLGLGIVIEMGMILKWYKLS